MDSRGHDIDLRLDLTALHRELANGACAEAEDRLASDHVDGDAVLRNYALDQLDPTQRVFADRVIA